MNGMLGQAANTGGMLAQGAGGGYPYGYPIEKRHNRTNVFIDQVENGFVVSIDNKQFICNSAEEVSSRILAQMVTTKMEK